MAERTLIEQAVRQCIALVDGPRGDAAHADYVTLLTRLQEVVAAELQQQAETPAPETPNDAAPA